MFVYSKREWDLYRISLKYPYISPVVSVWFCCDGRAVPRRVVAVNLLDAVADVRGSTSPSEIVQNHKLLHLVPKLLL